MTNKYTGRCFCGAVTLEVSGAEAKQLYGIVDVLDQVAHHDAFETAA